MEITLALGGGGSRGYAHVGVLRVLEREGFRIRAVAGTSAGGIIAALYAAGYSPEEMENRFLKLDAARLYSRDEEDGPGLLGLAGARRVLHELLGERTFSDLRIPCALTAVDVRSGREVLLNDGLVVDAILATIAVPGVFPPKILGGHELVDGGVLDPVPVSVARHLAPALPVVAVALTPRTEPAIDLEKLPLPVPLPIPILRRLTQTRIAQAFRVFAASVDIGARMLTELRLELEEPDVIIRPDVSHIGLLDQVDVADVIRRGERAAETALPELRRSVSWVRRVRRRLFRRSQPKRLRL
ncbi:MAG: patatin-like phospholipase family protein [Anaerolineales bacterium]|nr:patatin-like phospholipase family protein [Anaerolineales bacterium]